MNIFVDTNIFIDLIADRKPYSKFAIEIFSKAESGSIQLFASSHTIATTHYLLKKYIDETSLRNILYTILDYVTIISVDANIIKKSLKSKHKDFEDAIQILAANSVSKIDCIVTRDIKDFKNSEIEVVGPDELCGMI